MSTTPFTIADSPRLTLGETISDSRVMATRQLCKILRRPMFVVYLFVQRRPVVIRGRHNRWNVSVGPTSHR